MADIADIFTQINNRYGKTYVNWFLSMISSPSTVVENTRLHINDGTLGEYILTIAATTTIIGVTIGSLIPNRPPIESRTIVFLVISLLWIFLSLLVHFFCKMLGGRESSQVTMSLMIQNLAFVYVASNFLTLLLVWFLKAYDPNPATLGTMILSEPAASLFLIQFLLLLYFVPVTVSYAHGFRGVRWGVVALFSAIFAVLFGFPVYAQHGC